MDFSYAISVVMATFNTEITVLKEAVNSILDQTFKDFEFIIIDDGSNNGSELYLDSVNDERVRIIRNTQNIGITKSLNIGFKSARGKYIARMDADDVSVPERLEKQYKYMEKHPDVIVCGSDWAHLIDGNVVYAPGKSLRKMRPANMKEYRVNLLFKNPGPIHPSTMFRHEALLAHDILYDERLIHAQDYGMWVDVSHYGRVCVISEVLLYRRKHKDQVSVARRDVQINCDKMTQKKLLSELLGSVTDEEVDFHYRHSSGYFADAVITPEAVDWYDRLLQANEKLRLYDQKYLQDKIIKIKKKLIVQSFSQDMSFGDKKKIIFRYNLPVHSIRMIGGHMFRVLTSKITGKTVGVW